MACAVLRTSGSVISCTVETALGHSNDQKKPRGRLIVALPDIVGLQKKKHGLW
jgi:hypothetical protein